MRYLVLALWCACSYFSSTMTRASIVSVTSLTIDYKSYLGSSYQPLVANPHNGLDLALMTNITPYVYWGSSVFSMTDNSQYRSVGLNLLLGLRIIPLLDVYFEHQSEHELDANNPLPRFPEYDTIGVKLKLIDKSGLGKPIIPWR